MIIYSDGRFHQDHEPALPQASGGFLHGYGVFSTLRLDRGKAPRLAEHVQRLSSQALELGLPPLSLEEELEPIIAKLMADNTPQPGGARLRLTWTEVDGRGWLGARVSSLPPELARWQTQGIAVITLGPEYRRRFRPRLKTLNYLPSRLALDRARREGPYPDAIILDEGDLVLEGAVSNVFACRDGGLITPADDGRILPGLTRKRVLGLTEEAGLEVSEGPLSAEAMRRAEEVFLVNAVRGIVPVTRIDGEQVGGGRPGPITRALQGRLE